MTNAALHLETSRVIHVVSNDPHLGALIERAIAGSSHIVRRQAKVPLLHLSDILVLELPVGATLPETTTDVHMVLIVDSDVAETVHILGANPSLCHIIGRTGPFFPRLLASTLTQLINEDAWPFARNLMPGATVEYQELMTTNSKQACVDRISTAAKGTGAFSELTNLVATVASELLMNAFFNAPVDGKTHKRKYKDVPRQETLTLTKAESIGVAFGHDEEMFALSVRDNFGSLTRSTLIVNLERAAHFGSSQIRMTTQGAGVGLYMTLCSTTALCIRVIPSQVTEVTALFALTKRNRDFEQLGRSFSLFVSPSQGDMP